MGGQWYATCFCLLLSWGFLLSGAVAQQTSPNLKFHAFVFQHPSMNFDDTQHHAYRNRNRDSPSFYPGPSLTTPQAGSPEILPREFPVYRMEDSSEYGAEINDEMQVESLKKFLVVPSGLHSRSRQYERPQTFVLQCHRLESAVGRIETHL